MTTREVKPKFPPAPVNWFQFHRTGWYETGRAPAVFDTVVSALMKRLDAV